MSRQEIAWRTAAAARIAYGRARAAISAPRWERADLLAALAPHEDLRAVRAALGARQWYVAHRALSARFAAGPQRFVIAPAVLAPVRRRIRRDFPEAERDAAECADRLLAGDYDLLGYRGLRFDGGSGASKTTSLRVDWHSDPVHGRRVPHAFWADVPYLDPACGDHKIVWELNRHQHWLQLGRAYWLTGDARYRDRCLHELASWLDANPPLIGVNWASMLELALRTLSWIWALHFYASSSPAPEAPWTVDLLLGLDRQLTHIEQNLSYYFSPNTHLLGEALALFVSGRVLPELAASGRRAATGRQVLLAEIDRQIGADGGHRERSTHYHRYTLDFYLLALAIARITDDPAAPAFEDAVRRLAAAARLLADDGGRVPHLGDDDGGMLLPIAGRAVDDWRDSLAAASAMLGRPDWRIGSIPEEPCWLLAHPVLAAGLEQARTLPVADVVPSAALPDMGYYVSRSQAGDHLIVDGGAHGYQNGGHAHADALSLALTVRGRPLLIDPGTGCYTIDIALRDRMRSTALHNTLVLDDRPQSTPSGPFHWATSADAATRRWRANGSFDYFDGAHDGYRPLEHRRRVLAQHGDLIIVADLVSGDAAVHEAAVHWHVDPRWRVAAVSRGALMTAGRERVSLHVPAGSVDSVTADPATGLGWHSPVYGRMEPTATIRIAHKGASPLWVVSVFGVNADNSVLEVEMLPVWAEAGVLGHSTALRITRQMSTDYLLIAEPIARPASADEDKCQDSTPALREENTWRVGEFETDARMLFCRVAADRRVTRIAIVDGSLVRSSSFHGLQLTLPRAVPDLHVDMSGVDPSDLFEHAHARMVGPAFGATLVVGGVECPIAGERRAAPRGPQHPNVRLQS